MFEDIASGSLRVLHCRSAPYGNGYRFLVNPHKETMAKVQQFRAWMVSEMEAMRRTLDGAG